MQWSRRMNSLKLWLTLRVHGRKAYEEHFARQLELARDFGTPLYVMDEAAVRQRCRDYLRAFRSRYPRSEVSFASKAFLCTGFCKIVEQEGLNLDVASGGELYTALRAIDSLKILLLPFLPASSQSLHAQLGYDDDLYGHFDIASFSEAKGC